jgi:hypothetical protein
VGERPAYPYATDWNGRRFSFLGCSSCGSTFIDPVPTDQDFEKMYSRANYHAQFYDTVLDEGFRTSLTQYSHLLPSGDVSGFRLRQRRLPDRGDQSGLPGGGVELEQTAREEASRASGCEVLSFEEVTSQGRTYDIIHMGDVLEHLPDPAAMMEKLRSLLNAGGVFLSKVRWTIMPAWFSGRHAPSAPSSDKPGPLSRRLRAFSPVQDRSTGAAGLFREEPALSSARI